MFYQLLEDAESKLFTDITSWLPHGKAFLLHKPATLVLSILPHYFNQTQIISFQ
jgi:HSF-type DNA-binding